ncbi:hypothetical protein CRYPA_947 [uncultured Candidatus Thioglobus sp.]|uniref:hypothetical protein n=1 Tax=Bathymodiolus heckerae thiotrophic gill symbiont TaxID=1052212 RepID=UPI0010BC7584|nr:hypothetical protein [Bathymodiolus heckerae thiotrophic gill symbiont]SHN91975.1 hypothetical protein BHECKSOX_8 [Bathymodiolus heckerae thiotrophic gill symbiont]SMN17151.1 hypothetical protein CRYPA_947 [uncultured Candidatus Thioglobus sp.]
MGRYYEGGIEGKFWFAVQSSDDGEFFGAKEMGANWIDYCVDNEDKNSVYKGIKKCEKRLGEWLIIFDTFFNENNAYNDLKIEEFIINNHYKVNAKDYREKLEWYARLSMGKKMETFFKENPDDDLCFIAEL